MSTLQAAYKLLSTSSMLGSSNQESQKQFWKAIWELQVPHKIKHFIWRACHNALPTKCNLVRWKIITSEVCELCNEGPEDVLHALWKCRVVEGVWSCHSWSQQALNPSPLTVCDLLDCFLQVTEDFRKEIFSVLAWCLWNQRNALHFGRSVQPITNISSLASNFLQEFLAAQEEEAQPVHMPITQHQWKPPKQGYFKINFDAVVFKSLNLAGIGVIIRDWRGEATAALSLPIALASTVASLEALACRCAVMFVAEKDLQNLIFKRDSASMIKAISQESPILNSYTDVVDDIRTLVSVFQSFQFVHVHRSCNVVADALAKKAKCSVGSQEWLDGLLADIAQLVGFDVP